MTTEIAAPKRNGLAVLLDMLVAPSAAFAELRAIPHWGWAVLSTCILGTIGSYLQIPATEHLANYSIAHDPRLAGYSAEQLESAKKMSAAISHFAWIFFSIQALIAIGVGALVFLIANAIGRGNGTFITFFALAANVAFLNFGVGYLLHGIITAFRDPSGFQTSIDLLNVLPSLSWLVPGAAPKVQTFLASFTVFQIWSIVLMALGLRALAGLSAAVAWSVSIAITVLGGLVLVVLTVH